MSYLSTVQRKRSTVVHGRELTAMGPRTLCGLYGDFRSPAIYDVTDGALSRITCKRCKENGKR